MKLRMNCTIAGEWEKLNHQPHGLIWRVGEAESSATWFNSESGRSWIISHMV